MMASLDKGGQERSIQGAHWVPFPRIDSVDMDKGRERRNNERDMSRGYQPALIRSSRLGVGSGGYPGVERGLRYV